MKKGTLKLVSACLTIGVAASMFVGCNSDKKTASKGDVTTVEMWCDYASSKKAWTEAIDEYNAGQGKKDGVFIDFQVKEGGTLNQNVELALQDNSAPDIFTGGSLPKLVEEGYVAPIEDLPGGEEFLKYYKDNNMLQDRVSVFDGKTYKIPVSSTLRGLIYNKDMFKEAGIVDKDGNPTPPETFDELIEYAKKLTDTSKKQYGYILPLKWTNCIGSDVTEIAPASIGHDGYDRVSDTYEYEDMAPILDKIKELYKSGSCYPGAESIENDNARAYFAAGKIGMKMAYSFDVGVLNDQFPAKCDWGVAPVPVLDKDNKYYQTVNYGYSVAINKNSVEKKGEAIMNVFKFIYGDDFQTKMYENGMTLPARTEIIEKADMSKCKKAGWADFGEILKISKYYGKKPEADTSNMMNLQETVVSQVFSGKKTSQQVFAEYSAEYEKARQSYYSMHTEYKSDECKDTKFDMSRK